MADRHQHAASSMPYHCIMLRGISALLFAAFCTMTVAPTLFVAHFVARRAYIERELCIQREVAAEMRTCHGECHLGRQLRAMEQEAEQGFPAERIDFRIEPAVESVDKGVRFILSGVKRPFPEGRMEACVGHRRLSEPVPWG